MNELRGWASRIRSTFDGFTSAMELLESECKCLDPMSCRPCTFALFHQCSLRLQGCRTGSHCLTFSEGGTRCGPARCTSPLPLCFYSTNSKLSLAHARRRLPRNDSLYAHSSPCRAGRGTRSRSTWRRRARSASRPTNRWAGPRRGGGQCESFRVCFVARCDSALAGMSMLSAEGARKWRTRALRCRCVARFASAVLTQLGNAQTPIGTLDACFAQFVLTFAQARRSEPNRPRQPTTRVPYRRLQHRLDRARRRRYRFPHQSDVSHSNLNLAEAPLLNCSQR